MGTLPTVTLTALSLSVLYVAAMVLTMAGKEAARKAHTVTKCYRRRRPDTAIRTGTG